MQELLTNATRKIEEMKKIIASRKKDSLDRLEALRSQVLEDIEHHIDQLYAKRDYLHEAFKQRASLKRYRVSVFYQLLTARLRNLLSAPFIYVMFVPAIILDIFLETYHRTCFFLYRIPYVKRKDYIIFDRHFLSYLNWFEKFNCMYCSYVNGLFAYAKEIAGRTERYWCPIKHAKQRHDPHSQYGSFIEYTDGKHYHEKLKELRKFTKTGPKKSISKNLLT